MLTQEIKSQTFKTSKAPCTRAICFGEISYRKMGDKMECTNKGVGCFKAAGAGLSCKPILEQNNVNLLMSLVGDYTTVLIF